MAAVQDPKLAQMIGQSPMANQISGAMAAHIQEHLAFEYRRQIEEQLGVPYPEPNMDMPEDMEVQVSRLAAAGAQKLLAKDQAEAAQQQAQALAQDPVVQMKQAELQLRAKETEIKERKLAVDAAAKSDQLDIERERIAAQERIAGLQTGAKVASDKAHLAAKQQAEGVRMGIDIAREMAQEERSSKKESK